jgi:hypothetical protein
MIGDMTATTAHPNVLLITTDQQRFDALGLVRPDGPLETPTLDALACSGVHFRRAYSTSPVCIPARRSLLSGLHPQTHGLREYRDGLDWDAPISLPSLLGAAGYQTQLVGKLHLHPQRKRYGFDHMVRVESSNDRWDTPLQPTNDWIDWMHRQGYEHPNDLGINGNGRNARPWDKPEHTHLTSWLADEAVDFITRRRDPTCPFFMHLSFVAPHPPLTPPQAYWDRYFRRHDARPAIGSWAPTGPAQRGRPDDSMTGPFALREIQDAMSGYWASIHHVDDRIRYVLTRLFEYGSPRAHEPTLIIFTSRCPTRGQPTSPSSSPAATCPTCSPAPATIWSAWKTWSPPSSTAAVAPCRLRSAMASTAAACCPACAVAVPRCASACTANADPTTSSSKARGSTCGSARPARSSSLISPRIPANAMTAPPMPHDWPPSVATSQPISPAARICTSIRPPACPAPTARHARSGGSQPRRRPLTRPGGTPRAAW